MIQRMIGVMMVLVLSAGLWAENGTSQAAGFALLDSLMDNFSNMVLGQDKDKLPENLQQLFRDAQTARAQNKIDQVFFYRYRQLLSIFYLLISKDSVGLLQPVIDREIDGFMQYVLGISWSRNDKDSAIGHLASAILEEIINLNLYLDTVNRREGIKKYYGAKLPPPAPPDKNK